MKTSFTVRELEKINEAVETLNKEQHIEILKILKQSSKAKLTENSNGIFVDLNEVSPVILNEISDFLQFIKTNNENFQKVEQEKNAIYETINDK
jgi:glycine cleavage system regulatory protein